MERLTIETPSKRYPLFLGEGILSSLPETLSSLSIPISKIFVVTDEIVANLYLPELLRILQEKYKVFAHIVPSGENAKSFDQFYECHTAALTYGLDRQSLIIAFGGGVIGDLAGFVAATYMRGIPFIQIPTTLLAHDSAVGGKVAINHPLGKNMIGAFYQPEAIIYDVALLRSLPKSELRSGFAEVIKHALIGERDFYHWLVENVHDLNDLQGSKLQYCIKKGIEIKARIVKEDETEKGIRAYLNFGHTLGHAIESTIGYGKVSHGDAVAVGMLFAIWLSMHACNFKINFNHFRTWFQRFEFPLSIAKELNAGAIIEKMKSDKKAAEGKIRMVLLNDIEDVVIKSFDDTQLLPFICHFSEVV